MANLAAFMHFSIGRDYIPYNWAGELFFKATTVDIFIIHIPEK